MKRKFLLFTVMSALTLASYAQDKKKSGVTGYALTATEKGGRNWREVRMVDVNSGAELKTIFSSAGEAEAFNARTGKPVVKKESNATNSRVTTYVTTNDKGETRVWKKEGNDAATQTVREQIAELPKVNVNTNGTVKKVVNLDDAIGNGRSGQTRTFTHVVVLHGEARRTDKPFSTNSAAMAYDKKHDRLYYTPMNIAQLRYIDLKTGKVFYFEDEAFGVVKGYGDVQNQITRMVVAGDGNGYALTNDATHLIRFTTGKNPAITDLGALNDDGSNGKMSIHKEGGFGGDMIADADGNLYLVTATRSVYKINIESKNAIFLGTIKGLPAGFSTNGAMVEEGSKVIIASSESTTGYYRFDLETLMAEKVSESNEVFNASDLANGNLAFDRKKKKDKVQPEEPKPAVAETTTVTEEKSEITKSLRPGISVFPNPVTNGVVRLSFADQPAGRYNVQLLDINGQLITQKEVNINGPAQIEEFRFPELSVKGNYLVRVTSAKANVSTTTKIVVQ